MRSRRRDRGRRQPGSPPRCSSCSSGRVAGVDGDGYSASRILVPSIRKEIAVALGDPFYFAVPNRGFLVAWSQDYAYTDQFMGKVREDFVRRPYPISEDVFLVHGDVGTAPSLAADAGSDDGAEGDESMRSPGHGPGLVLFGSDLERRIDTWMFRGASWTKLDLPVHPPSRWASSMATLGSGSPVEEDASVIPAGYPDGLALGGPAKADRERCDRKRGTGGGGLRRM
jgi:hypothetical protein